MMVSMIIGYSVSCRRVSLIGGFLGLLLATGAGAHPYEDPLKFEAHTHAGGRVIFSNIPKRCFRDGILICHELHPIFPQPGGTDRTRGPKTSPAQ